MQRNRRKEKNGKTRDLITKIGDIKEAFHIRIGNIKDRNDKDLIEAEEIKKRWQEHTEKPYKKDLNDSDNHDGVITGGRHFGMQSQVGLRKHHYEQS